MAFAPARHARIALLAAAFVATLPAAARADEARAVDSARSKATFAVQHLYVARVAGDVPILAGSVTLAPDSLVPTGVEATLDARKLKTGDDDRDSDLQGAEWFDTKRFPTWAYRSTRIVPGDKGAFSIEGTLTVHGVAAPVTLAATAKGTPANPIFHAVGHVDRHAFHMAVTRTDALVATDVEITLNVTLK